MRMPSFITRTRRLPIGIDIGSESIKMLQLQETPGTGPRVAAVATWRFPKGPSGDADPRRQQAIEAVCGMMRQGGFAGRDAVSALSCAQVGIKSIRLPQMPASERRKAIEWEAKERLGFEGGTDKLNWIEAGEVRSGTETAQEVILLAPNKGAVDEHLAMLSAMKLSPVAIDAAPIAMFRAFDRFLRREEDEQTGQIIVEIGASGTRVVVARGRQIVFLKNIDVGGSALTSAVAKQFQLSEDDAAQFRLRMMRQEPARSGDTAGAAGETPVDWSTHDAVRGTLESLAEEVALCLRYCSVTFRGLRPTQIILCGGEAYDPFVSKLLGERLSIPCVVGRPLRGLDTAEGQWDGDRRGVFAEWAVCAGLATRNLSPSKRAPKVDYGSDRLSA